jgi:hypothetical protein
LNLCALASQSPFDHLNNAPEPQRKIVRGVIAFLEDRRVPYNPYNIEIEREVSESVLEIRREITKAIQAAPALRAMRAACREYLDQSHRFPHHLGFMLRAHFGLQIASSQSSPAWTSKTNSPRSSCPSYAARSTTSAKATPSRSSRRVGLSSVLCCQVRQHGAWNRHDDVDDDREGQQISSAPNKHKRDDHVRHHHHHAEPPSLVAESITKQPGRDEHQWKSEPPPE